MSQAGDEKLMLRYRDTGDEEAFSELVRRHERELTNYLCRYLGDASLAEDVLQMTLLQLAQKRHLYQKGRAVRPWLYTIATHQAIDCLRKERRHQRVSLDASHATDSDTGALLDSLASSVPEPGAQLEAKEQREWARRAVNELPKHQRAALTLTYFDGLTYNGVAQVLGVPVGTVKTRVHTAIAHLAIVWRQQFAQAS